MAGRRKRWISPDEWREKLGAKLHKEIQLRSSQKTTHRTQRRNPILDIPDEPYEIIMEIHEEPTHTKKGFAHFTTSLIEKRAHYIYASINAASKRSGTRKNI